MLGFIKKFFTRRKIKKKNDALNRIKKYIASEEDLNRLENQINANARTLEKLINQDKHKISYKIDNEKKEKYL